MNDHNQDGMMLYDVCNDYSLDPSLSDPNWSLYRKDRTPNGVALVHKEYEELHYFYGPVGLEGRNYFDVQ